MGVPRGVRRGRSLGSPTKLQAPRCGASEQRFVKKLESQPAFGTPARESALGCGKPRDPERPPPLTRLSFDRARLARAVQPAPRPMTSAAARAKFETFCRRVSEPAVFALTQLLEARQRLAAAAAGSAAVAPSILLALDASRSGIEHAVRLTAELYAELRAGDESGQVELSSIVDSVVELIEPGFQGRASVRRDYRPIPRVPAAHVMLARVFTTLL